MEKLLKPSIIISFLPSRGNDNTEISMILSQACSYTTTLVIYV